MTELSNRIEAELKRSANTREMRIIGHYDREVERGHMTINTACDRALADIAGANGHPQRVQRTLRSGE